MGEHKKETFYVVVCFYDKAPSIRIDRFAFIHAELEEINNDPIYDWLDHHRCTANLHTIHTTDIFAVSQFAAIAIEATSNTEVAIVTTTATTYEKWKRKYQKSVDASPERK